MESILTNRKGLAQEIGKVAEVAGYLWEKGWAERNGGNITINNKKAEEYIPDEILLQTIKSPLDVCNCMNKYDVLVNVYGGGISGQAGAIRHGLSRALADADESNRSVLGANGFLTRDSRMVERKKYGQRGARRRFQFSKR